MRLRIPRPKRPRRWLALSSAIAAVLVTTAMTATAGAASVSPRPVLHRTDVYTRDNVWDTGLEPGDPGWAAYYAAHGNNVYFSPDIKLCNTLAECPTSQNLVGPTASVWVHLNNHGPHGYGDATGTVYAYYSPLGGNAHWNPNGVYYGGQWHYGDWILIGSKTMNQYFPVVDNGVTSVGITWNNLPAPHHYCVLTRWVSDTDPMYGEGPSTITNTRVNNNISWRNFNVIWVFPGHVVLSPFTIRGDLRVTAMHSVRFAEPTGRFAQIGGTLVARLSPDKFQEWQKAGARGTGITVLDDGQIRIDDPTRASIDGITLAPGEQETLQLTFTAKAVPDKPINIDVQQYGPDEDGKFGLLGGAVFSVTNGQDQK